MILQSHSWAYIQRKNILKKDTCTATFIAPLFIISDMKATQVSINRVMDKVDVVHIHKGIFSVMTKSGIMPFATTWMCKEIII